VAPPEQASVRRLGGDADHQLGQRRLVHLLGPVPDPFGRAVAGAGRDRDHGRGRGRPAGERAAGRARRSLRRRRLDSRAAYLAVALVNAGSFLVYALIVAALPSVGGQPLPRSAATAALGDLPYLSLAAIGGVLALCWGMLSSGLPLWVDSHTLAPLWISALIVVLNAVAIAVLQIPVTRGVASPLGAARTARLAGTALALSCGLFALSQGRGGVMVVLILLGAATIHVAGELLFVAACWRWSVDLMRPDAPGQYQGVFATGQATAQMIAPAVMTTLVIGRGAAGWLALAGVFTLAVLAAMPATRWALRTRRTPDAAKHHEATY